MGKVYCKVVYLQFSYQHGWDIYLNYFSLRTVHTGSENLNRGKSIYCKGIYYIIQLSAEITYYIRELAVGMGHE